MTVCGLSPAWPAGVEDPGHVQPYWGSIDSELNPQRVVVEAALRWCAPFVSLAEFGCHPGIPNLRIAHAICPEAELTGSDIDPSVLTVAPILAESAGMRARFMLQNVENDSLGSAWTEVALLCYALQGVPVAERLRRVATKWLVLVGAASYFATWVWEMGQIDLAPSWMFVNKDHMGMIYRAPGDWPAIDRALGWRDLDQFMVASRHPKGIA